MLLLTGGHLEDPGIVVIAGCGEPAAMQTERHTHHHASVLECPLLLAAGHVPDPGSTVAAGRGEPAPIRAERNILHKGGMP